MLGQVENGVLLLQAALTDFRLYWDALARALAGREKVIIDADKVPGSGLLTDHFSDGATFSLRDAVRLMIAFSDNTATNLVLDRVGIRAVNWMRPPARAVGARGR